MAPGGVIWNDPDPPWTMAADGSTWIKVAALLASGDSHAPVQKCPYESQPARVLFCNLLTVMDAMMLLQARD